MTRRLLISFLIVLLITITFGWDEGVAPGLSIKNAILYVVVVVLMIENTVSRSWRFDIPSVLIPQFLFTGYCILSWYVASFVVQPAYYDPVATFISLKNSRIDYLLIFLLFFLGPKSIDETLTLFRAFLWLMVLGNLVTVIDAFNIPDLGIIDHGEDGRLRGPIGGVNQYAALLAATVPLIVALYWDKLHASRAAALAGGFVSILALLATGSRGAITGIVLGSMWSMFFLRSTIPFRKAALGILVSAASLTIIVAVFLTTDLFSQVIGDFIEKSTSGSLRNISSNRTVIWRIALERMMAHPANVVVGYGWDAYNHMISKSSHNVYLSIAYDLGIIGLFLYLAFIVNIFIACRRAIQSADQVTRLYLSAAVFGFASLCVANNFSNLYTPWLFIWAYVGLAMSLASQTLRASNNNAGRPYLQQQSSCPTLL